MAFEVTGIQVAIRGDAAVTDARRLDSALDRLGQTGTQTEGRFSRLARSTTTMGGAFDRLRQSVFSLQGAFGALGIGLTARELINMADASTQINNRLKLVTSTTEELVAVEERLFEVSQQAGASFQETVSLYARLTTSSQALNLSQEQLFKITESINQSIAITGGNSESAAAGLFQLSQALAAGQLRGDELNSVLEQTPRLAKAIADGLNAPVGQLRILAEQGELTAERVIQALLSQSDVIEREFNRTTLTVGQSFTQLSNAAIRAIGNINENIGGTQILSASMRVLATHMETVLKLIAILATAGLAATMSRFATATLSAAGAFNALALAMARNPFGLIAVGISTAVSALTLFKNEHITLMGVTAELGDFTNAAWMEINNIIRSNADEAVMSAKSSFSDLVNAVGLSSADIITVYTTTTNTIPKLWKNSTNLQLAILVGFSQAVTSLTKSIVESYANAFDNIKNIATSFFSSIQDFFAGRDLTFGAFRASLNEAFVEPTIDAGRRAREAFTEAFQIDYIGELSGQAVETANSAISSINTSLEGFGERVAATARETKIARLQTQAFTELMSGELNPAVESSNAIFEDLRGRLDQLGKGAKSSAAATKSFSDTFQSLHEQLDPVVRAEREFQENTALLNRALKEGQIDLAEYNKLMGLTLEAYNNIAGKGEKVAKEIDKASSSSKNLFNEADQAAKRLQGVFESTAIDLQRQVALYGQAGNAAELRYELEHGALRALSADRKDYLLSLARELDTMDANIGKFEQMQDIREQGLRIFREGLPEAEQRQIREAELTFLFDKGAFGEGQAAVDTLNRALDNLRDKGHGASDAARDLGLTFASAFEEAILQAQSLGDILQGLAQDILRMTTRMLITQPLATGLTDLFGGIGIGAATAHAGGVIGADALPSRFVHPAVFDTAPRFHVGGLSSNEVPAILQRGEGVFTPQQMAALSPASTPVQVQVIDQRTNAPPVEVQQSQGPNGAKQIRLLVRDEMKSALGSGVMDRDMAVNYGLRRPGARR